MRSNKRQAQHVDGNVGAAIATSRGFGDIRLWVESQDGYKHSLFLSVDEANRLIDCLADLLEDLDDADATA